MSGPDDGLLPGRSRERQFRYQDGGFRNRAGSRALCDQGLAGLGGFRENGLGGDGFRQFDKSYIGHLFGGQRGLLKTPQVKKEAQAEMKQQGDERGQPQVI